MISLKNILLKEYAERKILDTIERWKQEKPDLDDNQARAVINCFDQIKQCLASKLAILNLSDELKQNNNYLNIDKYSLMDMVNLLRSVPEKEDKIKKEAAKKFSQETGIPETTTRSYVARFFVNKENLKFAAKEGNDQFSKEEVLNLIPKYLQRDEIFLDPRNWRWEKFEQIMDALYPSQAQAGDEENYATTDADKVYSKDGIEIYKGDDVNKCISYSPKIEKTGRKKYGWCVSQVGNTNYDYYRFEDRSPTFYFVFDRNKPSTPEHFPFDDKWHAFVVQVNKNNQNESYRVTSAANDSDTRANSWEEISKIVPSDTWNKIKGLKDYFKPIDLSPVERGRKFASGKNLSLDEFKELTTDEKILYIQGKSSKSALKEDILSILPKYKIPLEGRSTTLANIAIDSGQKFPYYILEDYEALAKRYAIFRFRHTDYSKEPIPLPYVKYLDDEAKQKYLNLYVDNLTFEYIERFFGQKATENYVNEQVKNLDFLPQKAETYIKDPKQKQLFQIYSKLFKFWEFGETTNNDDLLYNSFEMPIQDVNPVPINYKEWSNFTLQEKEVINKLSINASNKEQYLTLLYALPNIITNNGNIYYLLPIDNNENNSYKNWVLVDKNNQIIKKYKGEDYELGKHPLLSGYPLIEKELRRNFNLSELKSLKEINESKYSFQTKIPLLKEIKVNNPINQESYTHIELLKDELSKQLIELINEDINWIIEDLINNNEEVDKFIKNHMIFNNYSIYNNGEDILLTFNNLDLLKNNDIKDYINENNIKNYLKSIINNYYLNNIEYNDLLQKIKKTYNFYIKNNLDEDEKITKYDIETIVETILWNDDEYRLDNFIYDESFNQYLFKELQNSKEINEIKFIQEQYLIERMQIRAGLKK